MLGYGQQCPGGSEGMTFPELQGRADRTQKSIGSEKNHGNEARAPGRCQPDAGAGCVEGLPGALAEHWLRTALGEAMWVTPCPTPDR